MYICVMWLQKEYNWSPESLMSIIYFRWKSFAATTDSAILNGAIDVTDPNAKSHIDEVASLVDEVLAELPSLQTGFGGSDTESRCLMQHHDSVCRKIYSSFYESMTTAYPRGVPVSLDAAWAEVTKGNKGMAPWAFQASHYPASAAFNTPAVAQVITELRSFMRYKNIPFHSSGASLRIAALSPAELDLFATLRSNYSGTTKAAAIAVEMAMAQGGKQAVYAMMHDNWWLVKCIQKGSC